MFLALNRFKAVIIIGTFILTNFVYAFNLQEAIDLALENNPEILAAEQKWAAAQALIPQVRWWRDPQFSIGFDDIPGNSFSPGDAQMRMYSISQIVPFPGKLLFKGRIAGKDARIAWAHYEGTKNEIIAKVKTAYYHLFFVYKSIEIYQETAHLIQNLARIAETKYAVGEVSQFDVLKAQVELSLIRDELITLEEEELPTAETRLNTLFNRLPHAPIGKPKESDVPELAMLPEEIRESAFRNSPKLKALEYAYEKSSDALTLAKMQFLPDFMVKATQEEMRMVSGSETRRGLMFSLNIPLWFWRPGFGIKEKLAYRRAAEFSYQSMKNMVLFEVQDALSKLNASERRVALYKTVIIPQAEQAMGAAVIAYETGKIDFLTLMNSERMLKDARLKYYEVLTKHGINLANLERVVGISLTE